MPRISGSVLTLVATLAACGRSGLPSAEQPSDDPPVTDEDTRLFGAIFGQTSSTVNTNLEHGLEVPSGIATCSGRLFLADSFQSRILIWNTLPARGPADLVLGQPDTTTRLDDYGGITDRSLAFPDGVACDDSHLIVADTGNNRVLIWSPLPTVSYARASLVLGQPGFTTGDAQKPTGTTLQAPAGVALAGARLFVADTGHHRLLGWATVPTVNATSATFVLGQADLASGGESNRGGNVGVATMFSPNAIASDGARLIVSDSGNNRVLVWNAVPATQVDPDFVMGQATFTTRTGTSSPTATSLSAPHGVAFTADRSIAIADSGADRVQVFASPITANAPQAVASFGITARSLTTTPNYMAKTFIEPRGIVQVAGEVYVSDALSHRVVVYDEAVLTANGPSSLSAKAVLGQPGFTSGAKRCPENGVTVASLAIPSDLLLTPNGGAMAVDFLYHRLLFWNAIPLEPGLPADFIIGQPTGSQTDVAVTPGPSNFVFPVNATIVGNDLYVVDRNRHRVMVWEGVPTSARPADRLFGQLAFDATANRAPVDGTTLFQPNGINTDGTRLLVSDSSHNRVLLWNAPPADATVPADIVFGHPDKVTVAANSPAISAATLNSPRDAVFADRGAVIADTNNNRVLIFNALPGADGGAADVVLGQADALSAGVLPVTRSSTFEPQSVDYADGLLYVTTGNRVLVWKGLPTVDNAPADYVIGQDSATSDLANDGGLDADTLQRPLNVTVSGDLVYVVDAENDRVVRRLVPSP